MVIVVGVGLSEKNHNDWWVFSDSGFEVETLATIVCM